MAPYSAKIAGPVNFRGPRANMAYNEHSFRIPASAIRKTSAAVREYFAAELGEEHSPQAIDEALQTWLSRRIDLVLEEMPERLISPGSPESKEFAQILHRTSQAAAAAPAEVPDEAAAEHPMFAGNRAHSPARLAAMMAYLSEKGIGLYKTKLNKLLFYADLSAYYLTGQGISGSRYVNLPFGPVPETYESVIDRASRDQTIQLTAQGSNAYLIEPGTRAKAAEAELTESDRRILDWVAETYGELSTAEITDLSHAEMAYKNTRRSEPIAYRYAEYLKTLPPKDLLA